MSLSTIQENSITDNGLSAFQSYKNKNQQPFPTMSLQGQVKHIDRFTKVVIHTLGKEQIKVTETSESNNGVYQYRTKLGKFSTYDYEIIEITKKIEMNPLVGEKMILEKGMIVNTVEIDRLRMKGVIVGFV
jgi:hypothetical protein